ncbi:hypothetical protein Ddc_15691 [Ditylenchus destructor]|nr:hypothetical protein Ddc_15691 [Ditylenchus destructor]
MGTDSASPDSDSVFTTESESGLVRFPFTPTRGKLFPINNSRSEQQRQTIESKLTIYAVITFFGHLCIAIYNVSLEAIRIVFPVSPSHNRTKNSVMSGILEPRNSITIRDSDSDDVLLRVRCRLGLYVLGDIQSTALGQRFQHNCDPELGTVVG